VQLWLDVYSPARWFRRIILDTLRRAYTVVDERDRRVEHARMAAYEAGIYTVSVNPWLGIAPGMVVDLVWLRPVEPALVEVYSLRSNLKHVLWGNGWVIGEKDYGEAWRPGRYIVPPPNPVQAPRMAYYEALMEPA
jgi:hypothetical protein